jgi:protein ImuA
MLAKLRKTLRALERVTGINGEAGMLAFGIAALDAALGGGLPRGALHEIAAASESHIAAATGFALALTSPKNEKTRVAIWIAQDMALLESGAPCGPGLDSFALAPERLITVAVAKSRDLLWAMEEALRCRGAGVVIGELRGENIEPVALRRLSLAASGSGALAVLLRGAPQGDASTATTRWIVAAAPSLPSPGTPRLRAQLIRNRRGPLGSWMLEWSDTDERFILASTHPQPVAQPAVDRPARAAVA